MDMAGCFRFRTQNHPIRLSLFFSEYEPVLHPSDDQRSTLISQGLPNDPGHLVSFQDKNGRKIFFVGAVRFTPSILFTVQLKIRAANFKGNRTINRKLKRFIFHSLYMMCSCVTIKKRNQFVRGFRNGSDRQGNSKMSPSKCADARFFNQQTG